MKNLNPEFANHVRERFNIIGDLTNKDMTKQINQYLDCERQKVELAKKMELLKSEMDVLNVWQKTLQNEGIEAMRKEGRLLPHIETLNEREQAKLLNYCDIKPELIEIGKRKTTAFKTKNSYRTYL